MLGGHDAVLAVGTPFLRLAAPTSQRARRGDARSSRRLRSVGARQEPPALAILADERTALRELAAELERAGRSRTTHAFVT